MNLAELAKFCEQPTPVGKNQLIFLCPNHRELCATAEMRNGQPELSCDNGCSSKMLWAGIQENGGRHGAAGDPPTGSVPPSVGPCETPPAVHTESTGAGAEEAAQSQPPTASAVPPPPVKAQWQVEAERNAAIYEWERLLAGIAGEVKRAEPGISQDALQTELSQCANNGEGPPPWLAMTGEEIDGSIAKVVGLLYRAAPSTPKPNGQPQIEEKIQALQLTELYTVIDVWQRQPWIWDGILPHGGMSLMVGKSETGKSTLVYALIYSIVKGCEFLGRQCEKGRVIYLAGDPMSEIVAGTTLRQLGLNEGVVVVPGALVMNKTGLQQLHRLVAEYKPALVVGDTLAATVSLDTDKYGQSYEAQQPLTKLARELGPNFMALHHSQKSAVEGYGVIDAALGSVGIAAVASTRMVTRMYRRERKRFYTFEMSNLRIGRPLEGEWQVLKDTEGLVSLGDPWGTTTMRMDCESILKTLLRCDEPIAKRTLWQDLRPKPKWVPFNDALDELVAGGQIAVTKGPRGGSLYKIC